MGQIDLIHFRKIALNNVSFSLEIIERFLLQSEEYKHKLDVALEAKDFRAVKSVMQQLKAQALVFGASALVDTISRIEKASVDKLDQYSETVHAAKNSFEDLVKEAQESKQQLSA